MNGLSDEKSGREDNALTRLLRENSNVESVQFKVP